jgi:hypothetical protein
MPAATQHANNVAAEQCGVDECEGELEYNLKATINVNDHECNVIEDTEDDIGIIFNMKGNEVKVSLRDFGSYVKFNRGRLHKGYLAWRNRLGYPAHTGLMYPSIRYL